MFAVLTLSQLLLVQRKEKELESEQLSGKVSGNTIFNIPFL